eukprot:RCo029826
MTIPIVPDPATSTPAPFGPLSFGTLAPPVSTTGSVSTGSTAPSAKLSILSLPSTSTTASQQPEAPALVRLSSIRVTFTAHPVRKHLCRPLRVVLLLGSGAKGITRRSRKASAVVCGGLASAAWQGECWEFAVPQAAEGSGNCSSDAILRLELQAVGLLSNTTLSFMSIDLAKLSMGTPARLHTIDFGF